MQSILDGIAQTLPPPPGEQLLVVADGQLQVAVEQGLRAYLAECAAAALLAADNTDDQRSARLRQVLPELTARLDDGAAVFPSDISGENLGLALCLLGTNPFVVRTEGASLQLDAYGWKLEAIRTVARIYQRATRSAALEEKQKTAIALPPPPVIDHVGAQAALLPLEFLVTLLRMLDDVGFNSRMISALVGDLGFPAWQAPNMMVAGGEPVPHFSRMLRRQQGDYEIYSVLFSYETELRALLRAVIAVLNARDHATNDATLAALPQVLQWAVHRDNATDKATSASAFFFSVLTSHRESDVASPAPDSAITPLMNALYTQLQIYPVVVHRDAAYLDAGGALHLRLMALLGAIGPLAPLPETLADQPRLWLQRRPFKPGTDPRVWFRPGATNPGDFAQTGPYAFVGNSAIATAMPTQMHTGLRLSINPNCRVCGQRIPAGHHSVTCGRHD